MWVMFDAYLEDHHQLPSSLGIVLFIPDIIKLSNQTLPTRLAKEERRRDSMCLIG